MLAGFVHDHDLVTRCESSAGERARHDGAGTCGGERTVDPQSRAIEISRGGRVVSRRSSARRNAQDRRRRRIDPDDLRAGQERAGHVSITVEASELA